MDQQPATPPTPTNYPLIPSDFTSGRKAKLIAGGLIIAILYIVLNVGIWLYARKSSSSRLAGNAAIGAPPRPVGPGQYACSPIGTCKDYADAIRKEKCTVTYADRLCLDQCDDPTKRCKE